MSGPESASPRSSSAFTLGLCLFLLAIVFFLLAGWLQSRYPGMDLLTHDAGHIWYSLLGVTGDPHMNPIHIASNLLIVAGFILLSSAWRVLYKAPQTGGLATTGPYGYVRHPQYLAFIVIMVGFLLQWPTLLTLAMFPVLVTMYVRLARREAREVAVEFGTVWAAYAAGTPRWVPWIGGSAGSGAPQAQGRR